jgi:hypothetical protein
MRCPPTATPPSASSPASRRTTGSRSRPTSRCCWTAVSVWPGTTFPSWTAPATTRPAAWSCAPQGRHRQPLRLPARHPGPPGHPQDPQPADQAVADRDRLRHHQPHPHPGQPGPARRPHPRALDDRERPALVRDVTSPRTPPSCGPGPAHRSWPACATWPSACSAAPGRSTSPPPPRPRPTPTARHPRDHPRMQQTSREHAGALRTWEPGPGRPRAAAGTVRRCRRCR